MYKGNIMNDNNLHKFWRTVALFLLAGITLGLIASIVIVNIVTPNYPHYYMSLEMFASVDRSAILPYISAQNALILFVIYAIFIFVATKRLSGDIKLFDKQNIPTNLLILLVSILIVGLVYPPFYIFYAQLMAFEAYTYSYTVVAIMLFVMLFAISYLTARIERSEIKYNYILLYSILYTALILGFEEYLLGALSRVISYIEILTNVNEMTSSGLVIITLIIIAMSSMLHLLVVTAVMTLLSRNMRYIPIGIISISLLLVVSFFGYLDRYDINKTSLNEASNLTILEERPKADRVILIQDSYSIKDMDIRVDTMSSFAVKKPQQIDITPQNISKLQSYIYGKEFRYYTGSAMHALYQSSLHMWDIERFREVLFNLIDNRASISYSMLLFRSSKMLPINEQNRKYIERLSDSSIFYIPDDHAYSLAQSWISFGDEPRAKELYDSIDQNSSEYDSWDTLLQKHRFHSGTISGVIHGLPKSSQVALMINREKIDFNSEFYNLKDIVTTKGRFEFTNLVEGDYMIAIRLKDDTNISSVTGHRSFKISKETPVYDEVDITIYSEKE